MRGTREVPLLTRLCWLGPCDQELESTVMMNDDGKSDKLIVPSKQANKTGPEGYEAEPVEERGLAKENSGEQTRLWTQGHVDLQHALDRIRAAATADKEKRFTALWHHVYNPNRLRQAYYALKRTAAPGVDGRTWHEYGEGLEERLKDLSERLCRGSYRAKAVKRIHIPKDNGGQRPLGITAVEDKLVQRATTEVLNAVYEADFLDFSHGFRPKRKPHDALDAVTVAIEGHRVSWVLDADIRGFFDTLDHEWLQRFIAQRIADRRVQRHIQKWLNAGVLEDGNTYDITEGVPQGGSISPLLSNIYLHNVLDLWTAQWQQEEARGEVHIVRFADDFVVGFQYKGDAERYHAALRERLGKFNLELSAEKTRLINFGRFAVADRAERGEGKPETFDFLGFTHMCGKTRSGKFCVRRKTMAKKARSKLKKLKGELRHRIHKKTAEVGQWLRSVLLGHFRYFAVPRNYPALKKFRRRLIRYWRDALRRRSDKKHRVTWKRMQRLVDQWLPEPRIEHPYPHERLVRQHPRQEPSAVIPHAGICAGGGS